MKKTLSSLTLFLLILSALILPGCGNKADETKGGSSNDGSTNSSNSPAEGMITFRLTKIQQNPEETAVFEDGEYEIAFMGASVLTGAYDGLELNFYKSSLVTETEFEFHLPATQLFSIYESFNTDDNGNAVFEYNYEIDTLPLTLTDADFEGLESDRVGTIFPKVELTQSTLLPPSEGVTYDSWSVDYFYFKTFELIIESFEVQDGLISMEASFSGSMDEGLYDIEGSFIIENEYLGVTEIE